MRNHRPGRIAVVIASTILCLSARSAYAQNGRVNVLVIVADDMGYADLGIHGSKDIPTPNIDALAKGGIRFTDAYVSGPFCSPTRAGLVTGRYPQRFGHEFNIGAMVPEHRDVGLPVEEVTIGDRFRAAGYRTGLVGKWHLGSARRFRPAQRGFDEFFGFLGGTHGYLDATPETNPIIDVGRDSTRLLQEIPYLTGAFTDRAIEFIQRHRARPFFLYVAFNAVHDPTEPTAEYLARFSSIADPTRRKYAAVLSAMDDGIGRIMAALRAANIEENTLVVFLNDNGGPLGVGWNGASNKPLRGMKGDTWEGAIRVPFIIRWKDHLPEGKIYSEPIIQLDVLPTALAAAGITVKPEWKVDGVNLLPFLTGNSKGRPHEMLYWRTGERMAIRKGEWKLVKNSDAPSDRNGASGAELYDLKNDIAETRNLAARYPKKVEELKRDWEQWNKQLANPAWPPVPPARGGH